MKHVWQKNLSTGENIRKRVEDRRNQIISTPGVRVDRTSHGARIRLPKKTSSSSSGAWSGNIRVAGKLWVTADITGTASNYVKVYFDGSTAPAYATEAEYNAAQYPSTYEIYNIATVSGDIHESRT